MTKEEIIAVIRATDKYKGLYQHAEYLPEPYCEDIRNVKAIVLGCDPSNVGLSNICYTILNKII